MSEPLAPRYDHQGEDKIYELWEKSGYFTPENCVKDGVAKSDAEPFTMVLPPPNVTGTLHIGHAFEDTVQDIPVRYHRMKGDRTLWIPGTDHAAISTHAKVEKLIQKEEDKSRYDLGREEFLKRVAAFAAASHDTIVKQVRRMGASLDWLREAYTLDEKRNRAVRTAFQRMYEAGLIYRGYRVVNWDPKGQTVISDDEVVYEERKAKLYTFKYGRNFPIAIATTRPETKFGDMAVAVHPDDERYKKYVGKNYDVDFLGEVLNIKIIADNSVDKEFGTGALGVTPAHSIADSELAERHGLNLKQVINEYGKMMVGPGGVLDKKTAEAREKTAELLRAAGLMEKEEEVPQNISTAERTGGVIEPLPKLQWFVAVNKEFVLKDSEIKGIKSGSKTTLKEIMRKAVEGGQVEILPERFERVYYHWIDNLRDWCISRQIWYGHRIPVWYCGGAGTTHLQVMGVHETLVHEWLDGKTRTYRLRDHGLRVGDEFAFENSGTKTMIGFGTITGVQKTTVGEIALPDQKHSGKYKTTLELIAAFERMHPDKHDIGPDTPAWIYDFEFESLTQNPDNSCGQVIVANEKPNACPACGGTNLEQDPDTLDTWFSSGMWPFSTLGWPDKTLDMEEYFPNTLMAPGYEILFMWVARMILMSGFLLGQIPFRTVYLHGIVRDSQGRKFSKSLGNGIDPLELANTYGADALRMSLIAGAAPGNDVKFSEDRVRGYRNFSTKIWNAARFVLMSHKPEFNAPVKPSTEDKAYLKELADTKKELTGHIEKYDFHLAAELGYHYFWHTFADKIVEAIKPRIAGKNFEDAAAAYQTLQKILLESITMLHPFVPFVTEAIYQEMRKAGVLGGDFPKLLMIRGWDSGL